jgi:hypothetical protein
MGTQSKPKSYGDVDDGALAAVRRYNALLPNERLWRLNLSGASISPLPNVEKRPDDDLYDIFLLGRLLAAG